MMVVNENKIKEEKGAGVSLMSKLDRKALSSRAWWRLIHDLNCAQATLITMQEYLEEVENPPAYFSDGLGGRGSRFRLNLRCGHMWGFGTWIEAC